LALLAPPTSPPERRARPSARPRGGWWGEGPPPSARWPGVTIELPAVYAPRRRRWESPDGAYYFDRTEAERARDFFPEYLTHHIGEFAGRPFELLAYQALLLTMPIFGWKRAADGFRRFRKVFAFLPKGAGKSPWASGTGLYLMLCDQEPAAEIYALATDKGQARVVHTNAKIMVEASPELAAMCEVLRDSIYQFETRSVYQVLSADATTKHGFRPHGAIFDEFHGQPNRDLYEAIKKSMVKRRQPLLLMVTHAGTDDESICYEEYEYAKRVLSGTLRDPTCLPVIFELRDGEPWSAPATWARVNPGHGITVQASAIAAEAAEAEAEPRKRNDFLRFHCNKWTNQATAWIPLNWWDACRAPLPSEEALRQADAAMGLDLAQKYDLACLSVVFRFPAEAPLPVELADAAPADTAVPALRTVNLNYRIAIVPFFWIPRETMAEHERFDGVPYSQWTASGLVTATEGAVIDYSRIYEDITRRIVPRFPRLKQATLGYDPAFATDLASQLRDRAGLKVAEVIQNYQNLSEPSQAFEALIKAARVAHGGHRVLRHHIENVAIKTDEARRIRPVRPKKPGKRIDGVVASIMAIKMLAAGPAPSYTVHVFGGGAAR
jgi:phage terminase large subunit-like protein